MLQVDEKALAGHNSKCGKRGGKLARCRFRYARFALARRLPAQLHCLHAEAWFGLPFLPSLQACLDSSGACVNRFDTGKHAAQKHVGGQALKILLNPYYGVEPMLAQIPFVKNIDETSTDRLKNGVDFKVCFAISAGKLGLQLSGLGCR